MYMYVYSVHGIDALSKVELLTPEITKNKAPVEKLCLSISERRRKTSEALMVIVYSVASDMIETFITK